MVQSHCFRLLTKASSCRWPGSHMRTICQRLGGEKQRAALVAVLACRDSNETSSCWSCFASLLSASLYAPPPPPPPVAPLFIVCAGLPGRGASGTAGIIKGQGCVWEMRPSVNEVCVTGEETGGGNGRGRLDPGVQSTLPDLLLPDTRTGHC